jgi:peptidoglycan/LPS O-acetylase OafA/YrhL
VGVQGALRRDPEAYRWPNERIDDDAIGGRAFGTSEAKDVFAEALPIVDKLESLVTEAISTVGRERHVARGHLLALDGIRGLAILMVIGSHAFESNYETRGPIINALGRMLYYGLFGVDLFFVLSGFLITGILFDSLNDDGYFRKFYARRALRIFPLYYGVLAVCLLLTYPLHLHWGDMGWLLLVYLQNLHPMQIMQFSPGASIGLYHFWSLAVEEQFYLIWPSVVFLVRGKRKLMVTMLVASGVSLLLRLGLLLAGASAFAMHVTMVCRADSLMLGGALAILYRSSRWTQVRDFAPWGCLSAAAVTVASILWLRPFLASYPLYSALWGNGLSYTVLALGFACLIAWSLQEGTACSWIFQRGWLRFLGKYSYGLYVLHVLVLSELALPLRKMLLGATHSKAFAVLGAGLMCIGISIVAAYASYHLYEKHFLKLKHRFDYSRRALNHGSPDDAFTR